MNAIKVCVFTKLFNYKDRASRSEFWWYVLFFTLAVPLLLFLELYLRDYIQAAFYKTTIIYTLEIVLNICKALVILLVVALFTVTIRRLHDREMTGYFCLFYFLSFIGIIILIILLSPRGTVGTNKYGQDPLDKKI